MIKVLCVVGPTAVGKTKTAVMLAKMLSGEVISADSMQIYRKMNIGTAKPCECEKEGIAHHMIDIAEPSENYSCADFCERAALCAKEVASRGKVPIFCGGTGLYIDNIINGTRFSSAPQSEKIRRELWEFYEKNGADALHKRLFDCDAESAKAIHQNNVKRVIRALEIYMVSGKTKTEWDIESRQKGSEFLPYIAFLSCRDRDVLYERIDKRVDEMFDMGLYDEVMTLYRSGELQKGKTAYSAIGYKEIIEAVNGGYDIEKAKELIKKNTRNYSKRQITWFSRHGDVNTFYTDEGRSLLDIAKEIASGFIEL